MITFLSLRELEILPDWLEFHASNSSFYNFRWQVDLVFDTTPLAFLCKSCCSFAN